MTLSPKRFTIVLPVHNGGGHIKECVASVLAQTFQDFDLVILENGSTDGTAEWLRTINDPRVAVLPSGTLLPIEQNWARILEIPKHEFLTAIGHDDVLDPNFLATINGLITKHPDAGLYQTHFRLIDGQGRFIRHCLPIPERQSAAEYLAARLCVLQHSYGTGHVMRSGLYDSVGGIPPYPKLLCADDALFIKLIGNSYRATAAEETFSYRAHGNSMGGGCAVQDIIVGMESYCEFLESAARSDPAIREVLNRYFHGFALKVGRETIEESIGRRSSHEEYCQTIRRVSALLGRFQSDRGGDHGHPPLRLSHRLAQKSAVWFMLLRMQRGLNGIQLRVMSAAIRAFQRAG